MKNKTISSALYEGYRSMLERGRYPAAVLFFEIPPDEIDVNVHPTKMEIKFQNESEIKKIVGKAVNKGFSKIRDAEIKSDGFVVMGKQAHADNNFSDENFRRPEVQDQFFDPKKSEGTGWGSYAKMPFLKSGKKNDIVLGDNEDMLYQLGDCYIVRFGENEILVTDQHAAHERIMYEFFCKAVNKKVVEKQNLLFPETLELSKEESVLMEKMLGDFASLGFDIEHFGNDSYVIQSGPAILKERVLKNIVSDILMDFGDMNLSKINIIDELIKIASCRAAIKAGDPLNTEEMRSLLEQLKTCELPFTCPHGRPTVIDITVDELEKRFRRK